MTNIPGPSQRYSGITDLRQFDELVAAVARIEGEIKAIEEIRNTYAAAYQFGAQNIPNNAFTRIKCETIVTDPGKSFSGGAYTVPVSGIYLVTGVVAISLPAKAICILSIGVNALEALRGWRIIAFEGGFYDGTVAGLIKVTAGQVIELLVYQQNAALEERGLEISEAENRLSIVRIA